MIETKLPSLGQNFRFGFYEIKAEERMRAIKRAGFDDVMIHWDEKKFVDTDGTPAALFEIAQNQGLRVKTCHFPQDNTNSLWLNNLEGEAFTALLIDCLSKMGERNIAHLVMHVNKGTNPPPMNEIGIARLKKALDAAEKYNVNIAFENVRFMEYNDYVFTQLQSEKAGFCYDCGHANCFTPGEDPLAMFEQKLVTTHFSDNFGPERGDLHLPLFEGNMNIAEIVKRLLALGVDSFNLETYQPKFGTYSGMDLDEYLSRCRETLHSTMVDCAKEMALI